MAETVLAEWEGELVSVHEARPAEVGPGGIPLGLPGRIVLVGIDGFIFQPEDPSPGQAEDPLRQKFYPWHTVRFVERTDPQG